MSLMMIKNFRSSDNLQPCGSILWRPELKGFLLLLLLLLLLLCISHILIFLKPAFDNVFVASNDDAYYTFVVPRLSVRKYFWRPELKRLNSDCCLETILNSKCF